MKHVVRNAAAGLIGLCALVSVLAAGPSFVDITWMSISNVYYELGPLRILTDGYITTPAANRVLRRRRWTGHDS